MLAAGDSCSGQLISYLLCMQSWLFGQAIHSIEPDAVALHTSHGYESPHSKFLMRLTVIASDILGKILDDAMCWRLRPNPGSSHVQPTNISMLCSVLSGTPVVFESVWRRKNRARKAMVAFGGAASASSLAH